MKKGVLWGVVAAVVLSAGTAGLFWADNAYSARLARDIQNRFQDGILLREDYVPLTPEESMFLYQQTASPIRPLTSGGSRLEKIWTPYLPDYGSGLQLTEEEDGSSWRLGYQTLDGLEVQAYYVEGEQQKLTIYAPEADLEVTLTGSGAGQQMSYRTHARRMPTPSGLWTALREELHYRLSAI